MECFVCDFYSFTDMVPRAARDHSISSLVVGGVLVQGNISTIEMTGPGRDRSQWSSVIQRAVEHNEIDYKYAIFGCNASGPLSLVLNVKGEGHVSVHCILCGYCVGICTWKMQLFMYTRTY